MKGGGIQGEHDLQTTLSVGCSLPMSAAKTDSPFIRALIVCCVVRGVCLCACVRVCVCVCVCASASEWEEREERHIYSMKYIFKCARAMSRY